MRQLVFDYFVKNDKIVLNTKEGGKMQNVNDENIQYIRKDTPYTKLVMRIYEKGYTLKGTRKNIAKPLGITSACFYERIGRKHRGTRSFRDTEILKLCEILRIPKREIYDYFMKPLLQNCNE